MRQAASGNHKEGDNLFIFMVLGDPGALTRGTTARLVDWIKNV
jgi:hypothetical protein